MSFSDLPFFPIVSGKATENGVDGVSPTITVTDITGGHMLTIVDINGTKTIDVMDGTNGQQGAAGQNGANATITGASATVDDTSGTPKVSVSLGGTASARTFSFAFTGLKGAKGDTGDQGPQGPQGPQGDTGPAYVLTETDKADIIAAVLLELNSQA